MVENNNDNGGTELLDALSNASKAQRNLGVYNTGPGNVADDMQANPENLNKVVAGLRSRGQMDDTVNNLNSGDPDQISSGLGSLSSILQALGLGDLAKMLGVEPDANDAATSNDDLRKPHKYSFRSLTPDEMKDPHVLQLTGPDGKSMTTYDPATNTYHDDLSKPGAYSFNGTTIIVGKRDEEGISFMGMKRATDEAHQYAFDAQANSYTMPTNGTSDQAFVDKINADYGASSASLGTGNTKSVVLNMNSPVMKVIMGNDEEAKTVVAGNFQNDFVGHAYSDYATKTSLTHQEQKDDASRKHIASEMGLMPATVQYKSRDKEVGDITGTLTIVAKDSDAAFRIWSDIERDTAHHGDPALRSMVHFKADIGGGEKLEQISMSLGSTLELHVNAKNTEALNKLKAVLDRHKDDVFTAAPALDQATKSMVNQAGKDTAAVPAILQSVDHKVIQQAADAQKAGIKDHLEATAKALAGGGKDTQGNEIAPVKDVINNTINVANKEMVDDQKRLLEAKKVQDAKAAKEAEDRIRAEQEAIAKARAAAEAARKAAEAAKAAAEAKARDAQKKAEEARKAAEKARQLAEEAQKQAKLIQTQSLAASTNMNRFPAANMSGQPLGPGGSIGHGLPNQR